MYNISVQNDICFVNGLNAIDEIQPERIIDDLCYSIQSIRTILKTIIYIPVRGVDGPFGLAC